ncbi:glycoprotein G [Acrasis kona]|uniref:Glycoprotein G n=1 Tax=Acrasis kona TaxID=1008807 RepID=A0AAW2YXP0_9EUKA
MNKILIPITSSINRHSIIACSFGLTKRFYSNEAITVHAKEIRLKNDKKRLDITFNDGTCVTLPAEYLRVYAPSADATSFVPGTNEKRVISGKRDVTISALAMVGKYALNIKFSDDHKAGMYSWLYLHELGKKKYTYMKRYILELREKKRSRQRKAQPKSTCQDEDHSNCNH